MKVRVLALVVCASLALAPNVRAQDTASDTFDFVRIEGTAFVHGGAPWSFVGANAAVMHGRAHRDALETTLDAIAADGGRVVRIWALGEHEGDAPAWADDYAFSRGPDGVVTSSFEHLDRVLAACRERGLRAIVVLANRWSDYGGVPQYLRWAGVPFVPDEHGVLPELSLPLFFESSTARALYLAHVERVVSHESSLGGRYADDPTILAWELFNEIAAPPRARSELVALIEEAAARVHALDPNHLVSAGHIGYELSRDRRTFEAVIAARGIDYADAHAYPTAYGHVRSLDELDRWVEDRIAAAHAHGRPLVFGEVGFTATRPRVLGAPRARYLERFLRSALRHGAAGVLPWIYASSTDAPREHALLVDGDTERTADLRRVIARYARRFARSDPREAPEARSTAPSRTVTGRARAYEAWEDGRLEIPVDGFVRARFEALGRADGPPSMHLFGMGLGEVRFRFAVPPRLRGASVVTVRVRASSELPGAGIGATDADTSDVVVRLDGVELGRARLPVDDGMGATLAVTSSDGAILARLRRGGAHTLSLSIEDDDAPGLCLYGPAEDPSRLDVLEVELAP